MTQVERKAPLKLIEVFKSKSHTIVHSETLFAHVIQASSQTLGAYKHSSVLLLTYRIHLKINNFSSSQCNDDLKGNLITDLKHFKDIPPTNMKCNKQLKLADSFLSMLLLSSKRYFHSPTFCWVKHHLLHVKNTTYPRLRKKKAFKSKLK